MYKEKLSLIYHKTDQTNETDLLIESLEVS